MYCRILTAMFLVPLWDLTVGGDGIIVPRCSGIKYDINAQTCCDGVLNSLFDNNREKTKCCGKRSYDALKNHCCRGVIDQKFQYYTGCCGTKSYDPRIDICCNGRLNPTNPPIPTYCCGRYTYNPRSQYCCGLSVSDESTCPACPGFQGGKYGCCRHTQYDVETEMCCDGNVVSNYGDSNGMHSACCGALSFDTRTHICCSGVVNIRYGDDDTGCCGSKSYDVVTLYCCKGKLYSRHDSC